MPTGDVTVGAAWRKLLTNTDIEVTIPAQEYSGSAITPALTVRDGDTDLTLNTDYTVEWSSNVNAGTATATLRGIGSYAGTRTATFTITPKPVTVTGVTATTRDFEAGNLTVALTGGSVEGKVDSDVVTVDLTNASGTIADANAGTGKPVTVTGAALSGTDAGNYTLSAQPTGVTVTINRIDYTGTATASATVRSGQETTGATLTLPSLPDGASYAASGTVGGTTTLISSHSISGTTLTYSTTSQADDTSATITVNVTGATNYNDYTVVVTVTAKDKDDAGAAITGGDLTRTYGDAAFTLAGTVTDAGTNGAWTWESSDADIAEIGETTGTVTIKKAGSANITAHYESDTTAGTATITLTVNPKGVTITGLSAQNKEYDGGTTATVTGTAVISGKVGSDDVSVSAGSAVFADKNAGTGKTVTFSGYSLTGADAGNYTLSAQPASVTANITAKAVTIIGLSASNKTYDGTTTATFDTSHATFTGKLEDDTLTVTATGSFSDANAGTGKTVTIQRLTLGGDSVSNYVLADSGNQTETTADIGKADVPAQPSVIPKTYLYSRDNSDSFTLTGLPADCGTVEWKAPSTSGGLNFTATPAVTQDGVLSYTVKSGAKDTSGKIEIVAEMSNYKDATFTVNITLVNQIPVKLKDGSSVTLKNSVLTYGQTLSTLTFNTAVFVSDDEEGKTVAGTLAWKEPDSIPNAGTTSASWIFTPADTAYAALEGTAAITVSKADIGSAMVTLGEALTYNGSEQTQAVSSISLNGVDITVCCVVSDNTGTKAGDYTLTVTAKPDSNYTGSATKSFTIAPKVVSVPVITLSANESVYTGAPAEPAVLSVKDGETVIADTEYTVSYKNNINAGTAIAVITDKPGGNYIVNGTKEFTITKADYTNTRAEGQARFGTAGMLELKDYLAPLSAGGFYSITGTDDQQQVLSGNAVLSGTRLSWTFKDDRELVDQTAAVSIGVKDALNYKDYTLTATLKVNGCSHSSTELRNVIAATCTEKGYSGDVYCTVCGALVTPGRITDIDPDNHDYDFAHGVVTRKPTILRRGETTYTCTRCHKTMARDDIPYAEEEGRELDEVREDLEGLSGNDAPKVEEKTDENGNTIEETITIGGEEVSKIITDPASGKETVVSGVWIGGLSSSYTYTGSAIKPSFRVYDGTKLLTEKTDYTVSWKKNRDAGEAEITLRFKGNYKGTKAETAKFTITPAVLGVDIVAHEMGAAVKNTSQKPVPVLTWASTGKTVSSRFFDISYSPDPVKDPGTYTATIKPKTEGGNFAGSTTALIRITAKDKLLSGAKVTFGKNSYAYTGKAIVPEYILKIGTTELREGTDYKRVSLTGNTDPGTATVIFEAVSGNAAGYAGSKTATFRITGKIALKEEAPFAYSYDESVPFAKGGAKPAVTVKYDGVTLKEGADYTVSYAKNKAVTNGAAAELKIKGKGKYKDTVTKKYAITKQSLKASGISVTAADQFTVKSKLKAPSVTVTDADGKKLKAGTDYTVGQPELSAASNTEESGTVSVTVTGKGNYREDEPVQVTYRYLQTVSSNIGNAKIMKSVSSQAYTGNIVKLSSSDLTGILYTGSKTSPKYLVYGTDFTVAGYSNNVKKGTAKVTLKGNGGFAGTKTLTFKIVQKKVNYRGALIGGEWK